MPFAGKWSLVASTGLAITLKDTATGELDLQTYKSTNFNQQLNAYGDAASKLWLQGENWKYFAYSEPAFVCTEQRSGAPAEFVLEAVSGSKYRVVQKAGGADYYLSADGAKLVRIP